MCIDKCSLASNRILWTVKRISEYAMRSHRQKQRVLWNVHRIDFLWDSKLSVNCCFSVSTVKKAVWHIIFSGIRQWYNACWYPAAQTHILTLYYRVNQKPCRTSWLTTAHRSIYNCSAQCETVISEKKTKRMSSAHNGEDRRKLDDNYGKPCNANRKEKHILLLYFVLYKCHHSKKIRALYLLKKRFPVFDCKSIIFFINQMRLYRIRTQLSASLLKFLLFGINY